MNEWEATTWDTQEDEGKTRSDKIDQTTWLPIIEEQSQNKLLHILSL